MFSLVVNPVNTVHSWQEHMQDVILNSGAVFHFLNASCTKLHSAESGIQGTEREWNRERGYFMAVKFHKEDSSLLSLFFQQLFFIHLIISHQMRLAAVWISPDDTGQRLNMV